ncbi:hypothetical protein ACFS5N_17445 [Mucilaginibacter ximonensis]|uniref:PKD domain-containing protein n=1 Tax=Mucilaginibacter ximonensis TaxID=538021 RepID=A0ABW5YG47_9SPHI
MKNLIYLSAAILLSTALIIGCKKEIGQQPLQLIASQHTVKLNQFDTLYLLGTTSHDSVRFSVSPSNPGGSDTYYSYFHMSNNKMIYAFFKPGTYTISATSNGGASVSTTVTVLNQQYTPPPTNTNPPPPPPPAQHDTTTIIPVAGDLSITAKLWKLPNTDSLDVIFTINSVNTYPCGNSSFNLQQSQFNNNFAIDIPNVLQPGASACAKPNQPIMARIEFFPQVNSPVVVGTVYPLTIKVGGTTYTGSMVYGHNYVDITWNYTSGVTFTSTHITL